MDSIQAVKGRHARYDSVVQKIRAAGTDNIPHFGNQYTHEGGYSLQQNPDEFAALTLLLWERCRQRSYLEIGSASGGALRFLHEQCDFSWLGAMDNHGHWRWVEQGQNWKHIFVNQFVGDSHGPEAVERLEEWASLAHEPFSVAFVDGDHSYEGVMQDIEMVRRFVRSGSLLVLHDIVACDGVKRAFDETSAWAIKIASYIGAERPLGIGVLEVP